MKFALPLAALVLCAFARAQTGEPRFEVASIKPNHSGGSRMGIATEPGGRFVATNANVKSLITMAYELKEGQVTGLPGWADSDRYDIVAKPESGSGWTFTDVRAMLRALLEERFGLALHKETKELPIYALVVARNGPRLAASKGNADFDDPKARTPETGRGPGRQMVRGGRGEISAQNVTVGMIADQLAGIVGRNVIDETGLTGNYDFDLKYTPEMGEGPPVAGVPESAKPESAQDAAPSIFVAVQEQLGLKLEAQKGPVDVYVIDRVEKPSEN